MLLLTPSNMDFISERWIISSTGSKLNHAQLKEKNKARSVQQCFPSDQSWWSCWHKLLCPADPTPATLCALLPSLTPHQLCQGRGTDTQMKLPLVPVTAISWSCKTKNNKDQGLGTSCNPHRLVADPRWKFPLVTSKNLIWALWQVLPTSWHSCMQYSSHHSWNTSPKKSLWLQMWARSGNKIQVEKPHPAPSSQPFTQPQHKASPAPLYHSSWNNFSSGEHTPGSWTMETDVWLYISAQSH